MTTLPSLGWACLDAAALALALCCAVGCTSDPNGGGTGGAAPGESPLVVGLDAIGEPSSTPP